MYRFCISYIKWILIHVLHRLTFHFVGIMEHRGSDADGCVYRHRPACSILGLGLTVYPVRRVPSSMPI